MSGLGGRLALVLGSLAAAAGGWFGVQQLTAEEPSADVIADRLSKVDGVAATSTHIAFRTYSTHDLEAAFSLGLD